MMFRRDSLEDEIVEQHFATRTDQALRLDLVKAFESLYLEVVLLRDFEELTITEIAKSLNEQPGAIKSRLHRARELVREYMMHTDLSSHNESKAV